MGSLRILKTGLFTSLQDLGRPGMANFAIPTGGAMDKEMVIGVNRLLSNPIHFPAIECTLLAPEIEFQSFGKIALVGADLSWKLNGYSLTRNRVYQVEKGDVLHGTYAQKGARGYIGIQGKIGGDRVHDSISYHTYLKIGNLDGSSLRDGDLISWTSSPLEEYERKTIRLEWSNKISIIQGPEYGLLTEASKGLLAKQIFTISPQSNRMGATLIGEEPLYCTTPIKKSLPLAPGMIQLPPSGHPIAVLQDGQVSGGYPRIAFIVENSMSDFNQVRFGDKLQFILFTPDHAASF